MSAGVVPESGPHGEEPLRPQPGDGSFRYGGAGWDADADLARFIAHVDAGLIQVPDEAEAMSGPWVSLAGVADPSELIPTAFTQRGPLDTMPPDAALAALADQACDPAVLPTLSDDQVLGLVAAGRRLAGRAAWIQQAATAEFAARRLEPDRKKASPLGFTLFAADELVPELVITTSAAELAMTQARDATLRLPASCAQLRDGRISAFQLKIIAESAQALSHDGAAEADLLLAAAAPGLTPGQLRAMCTRVVMMIDPAAIQRRKETAAKDARIIRFQEYSGNAALTGRELPPAEVLASSQHIDACARALRAAGAPGTLEQLRVMSYLDLTQGRDPLARAAAADQGSEDADGDGGQTGSPAGPADGTGAKAPVKAVITLLVPVGNLLGWSSAPGEIPGFGLLDPQTTRDITQAAAGHPETRWCVTVVGSDGTAAAHGCAPGRHRWTPAPDAPNAPDGPGPPTDLAGQAAQVARLLRRLRVTLDPIAKGHCEHRHYSDKYAISRKVKHLIQARSAKCIAPGCNRPAAQADADHTIPWPHGPSCECNLGPPCRYHHRNKQAPGWLLEQPEPGVMECHTPSGRMHTTYPTKYLI